MATSGKALTKAERERLERLQKNREERELLAQLEAEEAEAAEDAGIGVDGLEDTDYDDEPEDEVDPEREDATEVAHGAEVTLKRAAKPKLPLLVHFGDEDFLLPLSIPAALFEASASVPRPRNGAPKPEREQWEREVSVAVMGAWLRTVVPSNVVDLLTEPDDVAQVFQLWAEHSGWGRVETSRAARRAR